MCPAQWLHHVMGLFFQEGTAILLKEKAGVPNLNEKYSEISCFSLMPEYYPHEYLTLHLHLVIADAYKLGKQWK